MDIRSSLDALKNVLGVTPAQSSGVQRPKGNAPGEAQAGSSDRATLSAAGSEVVQGLADGGVRAEKVAEIQAALQAGTYAIPASAVAARIVDGMLERGK
jgi:flagellar biosynthesis anti-sigma factor FlgM